MNFKLVRTSVQKYKLCQQGAINIINADSINSVAFLLKSI